MPPRAAPTWDYSVGELRFVLDPAVNFLNHGSYGATPAPVLEAQRKWRQRMEADPVRFFTRELPPADAETRRILGAFLDTDAEALMSVVNATHGVNAVLRSLDWASGDEILVTDHGYNACHNAVRYLSDRFGVRMVVASIPYEWPRLSTDAEVIDAVMSRVNPRTKLALLDHVTSPTGLVFPVERLVAALAAQGVDTLVDGAHAPGLLDLSIRAVGAAYYVGNLHKWVCAPKGAAFLHVRPDRWDRVAPLAISHGYNRGAYGRPLYRRLADWTGTHDPSAWLAVPDAIAALENTGFTWSTIRLANRTKVRVMARELVRREGLIGWGTGETLSVAGAVEMVGFDETAIDGEALPSDPLPGGVETHETTHQDVSPQRDVSPPAPGDDGGTVPFPKTAMISLPLSPDLFGRPTLSEEENDSVQARLYDRHHIQVPIVPWPPWPLADESVPRVRLIRLSAHVYNRREQAVALTEALTRMTRGGQR